MSEAQVLQAIVTLREMLVDRGQGVGDLDGVGAAEVAHLCANLDVFTLRAEDRPVVFIVRKLRNSDIVKAAATLDDEDSAWRGRAIIVSLERMSGVNARCVAEAFGPRSEVFSLGDLQLNVSKHTLVPRHELMTRAETSDLLARMMLKSKAQLPSILKTDPMARYLGCFPGDVVRITRPSPTAGEIEAYRHCV